MNILTRRKGTRATGGKIVIDSKELDVLSYNKTVRVNEADRLYLTVSGDNYPFGSTAHSFEFRGEEWWVVNYNISAPVGGALEMQIEATNRKMSWKPEPTRPDPGLGGPKSRQPATPPPDPHIGCVPKEHYEDLKGLAAKLLNMHHNGQLEVDSDELEYLEGWQILHTQTDVGMTGFLAIPPEVHVET